MLSDYSSSDILNSEALQILRSLDNFQGKFLNELIEIFERDSPAVYDRLVLAIEKNTVTDAMRLAHKLKGMGANLGTERLSRVLEQIELDFTSFDEPTRKTLPTLIWDEYQAAVDALRTSWWAVSKAG
ncbi:MAG: Hpt domain-containing protein [Bdellovibrionota bacterium]